MNWNIFKKFIGIGAINIIVIILFLLLLEITFRLIFPEFKNDIHSDKITSGKFKRYSNFFGYEIRSLKQEQNINIKKNKKIVIVLGDSISDGFGHAYYDIWWNQLERLLKIKNKEYKFISISGFGNNFADNIFNGMNLISKLKNNGLKPYKIIYQFNFNDIQPSKREDLNKKNYSANKFNFSKWRYEYLNQSVFARVIQHYGGIIRRNTSGSCEERDLDALGPYTWTFGSKNKSAEAQEYWRIFAKNIKQFEEFLTNNNINFEIVLSPILYEIDQSNRNLPNNKRTQLIKYKSNSNFTIGKFLSYIIVSLITFVALIIILDTFKSPLSVFFPNLELILFNLFETLRDLTLFAKDLR